MTLHDFQLLISTKDIPAELRGEGKGQFLFAEANGRAVELSRSENQWWIEFWERSDDADAAPVAETFYRDDREAMKAILDWLAC